MTNVPPQMSTPARKREVGRGERALPRASGDCACRCPGPASRTATRGRSLRRRRDRARRLRPTTSPGSLAHLERALDQVGLRIEHVRLLVCTHAHSDHYGQAGPVTDRAGCELWMHPDHAPHDRRPGGPRGEPSRGGWRSRARRACPRSRWSPLHGGPPRDARRGSRGMVEPDRDLVDGVPLRVRPGLRGGGRDAPPRAFARVPVAARAPAADQRATDLLGRVSLYYDYGYSPDPAGKFLRLAGPRRGSRRAAVPVRPRAHVHRRARPHHGQPRTRRAARRPAARTRAALRRPLSAPSTPSRACTSQAVTPMTAQWWLSETLCYLTPPRGDRPRDAQRRREPRALADRRE